MKELLCLQHSYTLTWLVRQLAENIQVPHKLAYYCIEWWSSSAVSYQGSISILGEKMSLERLWPYRPQSLDGSVVMLPRKVWNLSLQNRYYEAFWEKKEVIELW